jgi:hypothetical protein
MKLGSYEVKKFGEAESVQSTFSPSKLHIFSTSQLLFTKAGKIVSLLSGRQAP